MAKGFKHGAGGGAPLNFKVVGNPQPSNPKENVIWVDTDIDIPAWHFSATQPENMAEGAVWFPTGVESPAVFNALKKNGIMVYPLSARQYVSGAWVDRVTKIYQGGEWRTMIISGLLYENGNENNGLTGGWSVRVWPINSAWTGSGTAALTRYSDHLTVTYQGTICAAVAEPMKDIDLSEYSTLEITAVSSNSAGRVYITRREGTYVETNMAAAKLDIGAEKQTYNFDISGLSGFYDIAVCAVNGTHESQMQSTELYGMKLK